MLTEGVCGGVPPDAVVRVSPALRSMLTLGASPHLMRAEAREKIMASVLAVEMEQEFDSVGSCNECVFPGLYLPRDNIPMFPRRTDCLRMAHRRANVSASVLVPDDRHGLLRPCVVLSGDVSFAGVCCALRLTKDAAEHMSTVGEL
eukprot:364410-Chlamydomonas_euryale.AAC.8